MRAPLVPPAGRNLSGSAGARKPSVQDKAQAAERPCAALEGLPHLVPCRSWGPSAAPASACSPSVPTRLEVPLQRRAPHPQAEPHLDAAAACLEGRGGGQQARRALWASGARWSRPPRPTEHHRSAVAIPWPRLPQAHFPRRRSRRSSCGIRVAPCSVRVAERALLPRVVTRGIAATLQRKVARSPALSRPQRRAVARASTKAALRKHTPKHTLVDEGLRQNWQNVDLFAGVPW